jgi:hypothetical protein
MSSLGATPHPSLAITPSAPGPRVPGYRCIQKLGEGTYGEVWLFEETRTGVRVAVKFFDHGTNHQWHLLQAEVRQLARLDGDPGIVELKDVAPTADPPYYVMRYAEKGSLTQRLELGPLSVLEALRIFREAAEALAYVHAKGIRHCDLKPGNVLLDSRGRALLGDFGQAHLCSDLTPALGTYFYMAPEQADLAEMLPDTRWDVYGLGALFYTMVTGSAPRETAPIRDELARTPELPSRLQCYRDWVRRAPRPDAHRRVAGMDRGLAAIIDRCLAVDPAKRYRDAAAVLAALDRRAQSVRRQPVLVFGLIAPLLLLLTMAVNAFVLSREALAQSERAVTSQLRANSLINARLMANMVEQQLLDRVRLLSAHARDPELARAVASGLPHQALHARLLALRREDNEDWFFKWMLADRGGRIVADEPQEPTIGSQDRRWCWRDWFNGAGHQAGRQYDWFPPVDRLHVSQPYVAPGSDEYGNPEPLTVSISAPLRDPDQPSRVVGLLVASMHAEDLHRWLQGIEFHESNGFPVLVDDRLHCLLHRDEAEVRRRIRQHPDSNPEPLTGPLYESLLHRCLSGTLDDHVDPFDGKTYIAGYAPVGGFGWGVVVQHERGLALEPIEGLQAWMRSFGTTALVGTCLLTTGLWGWLVWTLRRGEEASGAG